MSFCRFYLAFSFFLFCFHAQTAYAQVSKGNLILMNRGLQLQGLVSTGDYFHLDTYTNANYSTIGWGWTSDPSQLSGTKTPPWSRWVDDITNMPPIGGEPSYMSNLVSLSLSDEPYLDSQSYFTKMTNWFLSVKDNYPNTILFLNNWGGEVSDGTLSSFIAQGKPDMITFDQYPWQSDQTTGVPIAGPPTSYYNELRRYRAWAMAYNIPFGTYRQTYHAVESDGRIMRNPSPSELRLSTFSALAFNAKTLMDFTYNSGASSLFDRNSDGQWVGDGITNALYNEMVDSNLRARNLGRALVRLKPIAEQSSGDGHTTGMMIVRGKTVTGGTTNLNSIPVGFIADPQAPTGYTDWTFALNDPYLSGFQSITNIGTKNNGQVGDVIISWFKPLDNSLMATNATNQIYMMVVNGLTDTNGTPSDCAQVISLDLTFTAGSGTNGVVLLNPATGQLQTNAPLPLLFDTKRRLTLTLNGGDAALFKFHDSTAFVGFAPPLPATLALQRQGGVTNITMQGRVGDHYQLETSASLPNANWTILTNILLPSSTYTFTDTISPSASNRFYRVVNTP